MASQVSRQPLGSSSSWSGAGIFLLADWTSSFLSPLPSSKALFFLPTITSPDSRNLNPYKLTRDLGQRSIFWSCFLLTRAVILSMAQEFPAILLLCGGAVAGLGSSGRGSCKRIKGPSHLVEWLLLWFVISRRVKLESLVDDHLEVKLLYSRRYRLDKEIKQGLKMRRNNSISKGQGAGGTNS